MRIAPEGLDFPISLTKIVLTNDLATWMHTSVENIKLAWDQAELIFGRVLRFSRPHDEQSLESLLRSIGEFHWWLSHACGFERGSASITKMLIASMLKAKGVEAGGFGDIEPDCMALIQNITEYRESYSMLMRFPKARLIDDGDRADASSVSATNTSLHD